MKRCIVFAGINGAGKTTFFHTGLWQREQDNAASVRINPDELLVRAGGDSANPRDQLAAGKEAIRLVEQCIDAGHSFNWETTLSGHFPLKVIRQARDAGFSVELFYIGLASAELASERIAHRVAAGGHDIPAETVRRRWKGSLANFGSALDFTTYACAYDNSVQFTCLAAWTNGMLSWIGPRSGSHQWLLAAMTGESWRS